MSESLYEEMFGESCVGRPTADEPSVGMPTGDRKITEAARRRATRVIRNRYKEEFQRIMADEADFLLKREGSHDSA